LARRRLVVGRQLLRWVFGGFRWHRGDRVSDESGSLEHVSFVVSGSLTSDELNVLFAVAWPDHSWRDFDPILRRSLAYVCAYQDGRLVGFVNVAWDGGVHAFLLDTTVHPSLWRRGVGRGLVGRAVESARERGITWLHVDYEPRLAVFYERCGFRQTTAGLMRLADE
jgi:GNAT superfamily N-acetyltransferase